MADPYMYEDVNVLRNLMGIKNQQDLDAYENTVVNLSLIRILKEEISIEHTLDVLDVHRQLFSDIYDWAGHVRTINIEKQEMVLHGLSVPYEDASNIVNALEHVHSRFFDQPWDTYTSTSLIHNVTRYIAAIWKIHPFREGNTRTVSTYLLFFLRRHGFSLDAALLKKHAAYFRNALVMASLGEYSEYQYLETILEDAVIGGSRPSEKRSSKSTKYDAIKDVRMEDYTYNYHQQKKNG